MNIKWILVNICKYAIVLLLGSIISIIPARSQSLVNIVYTLEISQNDSGQNMNKVDLKIKAKIDEIEHFAKKTSEHRNYPVKVSVVPTSKKNYIIKIESTLDSSKKATVRISEDRLLNFNKSELNRAIDSLFNDIDPGEMPPPGIGQ